MDLAVAFEVIEHIEGWQAFLSELRRVLAPAGRLVISTPNRDYYAETRRRTGPNPYHVHEFGFEEFAAELRALFPHVALYVENHVEGIAFAADDPGRNGAPELGLAAGPPGASDTAHFFLAVCSAEARVPPPAFLYVPAAANVLREREIHIDKLELDVAGLRAEKQNLVEMFRTQTAELQSSNQWARELDEKLTAAQARIVQVQNELAETQAGYESKIAGLESENLAKTEWARRLDAEVEQLRAQLHLMRSSRWVRAGNRLGVGPESR
jgi:hypothetical protein